MNVSTCAEVGPPTFDDFETLKETFLCVAEEPDTITRSLYGGLGLFVKLERLYADIDMPDAPPLTICLSGLLRIWPRGNRLVMRYRELAHSATTENSSINHDYIFTATEGQLVEFGHSMLACPKIPEPRQEIVSDAKMDQADRGKKILQQYTGNQLELTAGDCGVLFDRMVQLVS